MLTARGFQYVRLLLGILITKFRVGDPNYDTNTIQRFIRRIFDRDYLDDGRQKSPNNCAMGFFIGNFAIVL